MPKRKIKVVGQEPPVDKPVVKEPEPVKAKPTGIKKRKKIVVEVKRPQLVPVRTFAVSLPRTVIVEHNNQMRAGLEAFRGILGEEQANAALRRMGVIDDDGYLKDLPDEDGYI